MIMGRDSYEIAESAWGPHPPFENPTLVLTHRARDDDVREGSTFTFVADGFDAALDRARAAASDKDVMLHGGTAIPQGLRAASSTTCSCTSGTAGSRPPAAGELR
jgi:dihydrofolate reductase